MKNCDLFVCRYVESCIVGVSCENGMYPVCKFQLCHVCCFKDKCKKKENILFNLDEMKELAKGQSSMIKEGKLPG